MILYRYYVTSNGIPGGGGTEIHSLRIKRDYSLTYGGKVDQGHGAEDGDGHAQAQAAAHRLLRGFHTSVRIRDHTIEWKAKCLHVKLRASVAAGGCGSARRKIRQ
jgi:hypothetical protein